MSTDTSVGTIGFVGLGDMGAGIAASYAREGLDLVAFDLRPELAKTVEGWGGRFAISLADVASSSDVLCLCLVDDKQVLGLLDGGLLDDVHRGAVLVVHSTVSPQTMAKVAEVGDAHGVEVLDAPVSGGHAASVAGTLSVMVGGPRSTYDRLAPMWDAMSSAAYWIGEQSGAGQVAKLCNNLMGLTNNLVALEAMGLARAYGVEESTALAVASTSTGDSWYVEHWGFIDGLLLNHPQAGRDADFHLLMKDLRSAVQIGEEGGAVLSIGRFAIGEGERILGERLALLEKLQAEQQ